MDPLSIGAAAASITVSSMKVASALYTYIDETKQVEDNIKTLCDEVRSLSTVSDVIHKTWTQNQRVAAACANDDTELWANVKLTLNDCRLVVKRFSTKMEPIKPSSTLGRNFFRKSVLVVRLNLKTKDIDQFRQQIRSHYCALQSCLLTIQVCLQLDQNASQNTIERTLTKLLSYLENTKLATEPGGPYNALQTLDAEDKTISLHLRELVRNTQSFHSSRSTVVGTKTVAGNDSVLGDPLPQEDKQRIIDYIATINEDNDEDYNQNSKPKSMRHHSDQSSLALDLVLGKRCLKLAINSFEQRDWPKAQEYLSKGLTYAGEESRMLKDISAIKIVLASTCALQEKWDDLESVIVPGLGISENDEPLKLDLLSMLYLQKKDYTTALEICRSAVQLKWSIYGQTHDLSLFSISLLVEICTANGDMFQADLWLDFIPQDLEKSKLKFGASDSVFLTAIQPILERIRTVSTEEVTKAVSDQHGDIAGASNPTRLDSESDEERVQIFTQDKISAKAKRSKDQTESAQHNAEPKYELPLRTRTVPSQNVAQFELTWDRLVPQKHGAVFRFPSRMLLGHENDVSSLAFAPDSSLVASGSWDCTLRLWSAKTGQIYRTFRDCKAKITCVAFAPNGELVASGSEDKTLRLWNIISGYLERVIECHSVWVSSIIFTTDSRFIVSAQYDNTVQVWDVTTGALHRTFEGSGGLSATLAISSDGRRMALGVNSGTWVNAKGIRKGSGWIRVFDVATWLPLYTIENSDTEYLHDVIFAPDSSLLASVGKETLNLWDAATGSQRRRIRDKDIACVSFSSEGRVLITGSIKGDVKLWNAATGKEMFNINGHVRMVKSLVCSPNGQFIASGSADNTIRLWTIVSPRNHLNPLLSSSQQSSGTKASNPFDISSASDPSDPIDLIDL